MKPRYKLVFDHPALHGRCLKARALLNADAAFERIARFMRQCGQENIRAAVYYSDEHPETAAPLYLYSLGPRGGGQRMQA